MQTDTTNGSGRSPSGHIRYLAFLLFAFFASAASAQRYEVGDIVENFTLIDRATNQEVSLYDMEDKVIFLEWFAYWLRPCSGAHF